MNKKEEPSDNSHNNPAVTAEPFLAAAGPIPNLKLGGQRQPEGTVALLVTSTRVWSRHGESELESRPAARRSGPVTSTPGPTVTV